MSASVVLSCLIVTGGENGFVDCLELPSPFSRSQEHSGTLLLTKGTAFAFGFGDRLVGPGGFVSSMRCFPRPSIFPGDGEVLDSGSKAKLLAPFDGISAPESTA